MTVLPTTINTLVYVLSKHDLCKYIQKRHFLFLRKENNLAISFLDGLKKKSVPNINNLHNKEKHVEKSKNHLYMHSSNDTTITKLSLSRCNIILEITFYCLCLCFYYIIQSLR